MFRCAGQAGSGAAGLGAGADGFQHPGNRGKDSMSGSFNDLDVPPTLVNFAMVPEGQALRWDRNSKKTRCWGLCAYLSSSALLPDAKAIKASCACLHRLMSEKRIYAAVPVDKGRRCGGMHYIGTGQPCKHGAYRRKRRAV